jgi:hypothetical protein
VLAAVRSAVAKDAKTRQGQLAYGTLPCFPKYHSAHALATYGAFLVDKDAGDSLVHCFALTVIAYRSQHTASHSPPTVFLLPKSFADDVTARTELFVPVSRKLYVRAICSSFHSFIICACFVVFFLNKALASFVGAMMGGVCMVQHHTEKRTFYLLVNGKVANPIE